jgi:L-ascorbate metabolism protein UlaG (beta-lactamase superfamily)
MKIRYIASACVMIESQGVRILTDPWLTDGEYYGSWYHYPPLEYSTGYFDDIDYIYVSHIHPDHFSKATFSQLNQRIPVLIHTYESKFLKREYRAFGVSGDRTSAQCADTFERRGPYKYPGGRQLQSGAMCPIFRLRPGGIKVWFNAD